MNSLDAALTQQSDNEYTLRDDVTSVWITVDLMSIYIVRNDTSVFVDIYAKGAENDDALANLSVPIHDAREFLEKLVGITHL